MIYLDKHFILRRVHIENAVEVGRKVARREQAAAERDGLLPGRRARRARDGVGERVLAALHFALLARIHRTEARDHANRKGLGHGQRKACSSALQRLLR